MNPLDPHKLIDERREEIFADYAELLRIPSISALSAHNADTQRAARFVSEMLRHQGLEHIEVIQTAGAPLVYADWMRAPGKPTLLIYAHYDVQPIDPAREWSTPPFEPTVQGDVVYGRGVTDDKNNLTGTIHAVGAILAAAEPCHSTSGSCWRVRKNRAARLSNILSADNQSALPAISSW